MKACSNGREKAKGATFFEATEGETVRPMLDVSWAPMLGAFSVLFEEYNAGNFLLLLVTCEAFFSCVELYTETATGLPTLHAAVERSTIKYTTCLKCVLYSTDISL